MPRFLLQMGWGEPRHLVPSLDQEGEPSCVSTFCKYRDRNRRMFGFLKIAGGGAWTTGFLLCLQQGELRYPSSFPR